MATLPRTRLVGVFREALNLRDNVPVEELKYNSIKAWDSLAHMSLVAALESEFDIMLETDDVLDLSSFPKCIEILGKHGIEFAA